jgi:periplasmic divalent cation tolerance protein
MSDICVFYVTWPDLERARDAATRLVEARLVGCVVLTPGAVSIYRWEGAIEETAETIMLAKTTADRADAAEAMILDLHPYEVPAVLRLPVEAGQVHPGYRAWLSAAVGLV